jgi:hypothetical protein
MIDPDAILKYDCTTAELEERLLFWIAAAGKNAHTTARCLAKFLRARSLSWPSGCVLPSPFAFIRGLGEGVLRQNLRGCGFGCYTLRATAFSRIANAGLDLHTVSPAVLATHYGIKHKTARAFVMYSRRRQRYVIADVHVLRHARARGLDVPASTPTSAARYLEVERLILDRLVRPSGLSPLAFDQLIWRQHRRRSRALAAA